MLDEQIEYISLIFTSVSAFGIILTYLSQRIHNRKMVTPIVAVVCNADQYSLIIKIKNCGLGPTMITRVAIMNSKKGVVGRSNKEFLDILNVDGISGAHQIKTFYQQVSRRAPIYLLPNEDIVLFDIPYRTEDGTGIVCSSEEVQSALFDYSISLRFEDLYKTIRKSKINLSNMRYL